MVLATHATHATHATSRLLAATIPGPAGPLEALVRVPEPVLGVAVMAHPHPLHGGTMHTKVVHRTARLLADRFGLLSVRFNFRGVGASAGEYDDGCGEVDDVVAACAWVRGRHASGPLVLGGFSFGSLCALGAQPRVKARALLLVGIPLERMEERETQLAAGAHVVWVHGDADTVAPLGRGRDIAARAGWDLAVVPGADHFFTERLAELGAAAEAGLRRALEGR